MNTIFAIHHLFSGVTYKPMVRFVNKNKMVSLLSESGAIDLSEDGAVPCTGFEGGTIACFVNENDKPYVNPYSHDNHHRNVTREVLGRGRMEDFYEYHDITTEMMIIAMKWLRKK